MTDHRRRLTSTFEALKRTLNGPLMRTGGITEQAKRAANVYNRSRQPLLVGLAAARHGRPAAIFG